MTEAAKLQSLLLYKAEEADLTLELTNIMADRTRATKKTSSLAQATQSARAVYTDKASSNSTYAQSTQYAADLKTVEDDYEVKLAEINSWEAELEQKQNNIETQIKELNIYEENCTSQLKSDIKVDFTYGGSGGSSS